MSSHEASHYEVQGGKWLVRLDWSETPTFWRMELVGQTAGRRNAALAEAIHHCRPHLTDASGMFYPLLIDARQEGQPSMAGMEGGKEMLNEFGRNLRHVVFLIDPTSRQALVLTRAVLSVLGMVLQAVAGIQFEIVTSEQDARAHLQQLAQGKAAR